MGKLYDLDRINEEYRKLKTVKFIALITLLVGVLATTGGIALAALVNSNVGMGFILGGLVVDALSVMLIIFVDKRVRKLHIAIETGKSLFKLDKKLDMNALADKYTNSIKLFTALCDDIRG